MRFGLKLPFALLPGLILANGCGFGGRTPQVAGVFAAGIACPDCSERWDGAPEIVLNQNGRNLTGTLRINHPAAGSILVPLSAGVTGDDGRITLTGQARLALGSIEVSFTGQLQPNELDGRAILILRSPLAGSRQQNTILRLKNRS
jgi:hypothetical protein